LNLYSRKVKIADIEAMTDNKASPDDATVKFKEVMYNTSALRRRWPTMLLKELAQGIDDSINAANPAIANKPGAMTDFPKPYWHLNTCYSKKGKEITKCIPCEVLFMKNGEYKRPYKSYKVLSVTTGEKTFKVDVTDNVEDGIYSLDGIYSFKRILFRKTDILALEAHHRDAEGNFIFDEPEKNISVTVPQKLFAGKSARGVISAMSAPEYSFAPEVIAYVLYNWCGQTKFTQLGEMLLMREGKERTESAYGKHARKLLRKAEDMEIVDE